MKRSSLVLVTAVMILFVMGLLMVFNTTSAEVLNRLLDRNTHYALIKQIFYAFIGLIAGLIIWFFGYQNILKISGPLLIFGTLLLVLVFVPGIGQEINGAHRWVICAGYSFQPSEFIKYLIPMYYIFAAGKYTLFSFLKVIGSIAIPIGLILVEPDNGSVAIILLSLLALFILTRLKWIYWVLPLLILTLAGVVVASKTQYVSDRIKVYMNPELDLKGKGHQPHQAKIAAGSGKLFGKGPAESLQKLDYLPEAHNDYIAAIFAEEYGFIGILVLIFLYMLIAYLGFYIAAHALDRQSSYLASIFTFLITFQAFLNLGVVSGLLPSKGTNLPFFSQGGSSLLANFMALCVILNIDKASKKILTPAEV